MSSGSSVTVRVPAKINLMLAVGALRPDGFHELVTVFQALSLTDDVTVSVSDAPGVEVHGEGAASVPADDTNLAWRAAAAVAARVGRPALLDRLRIVLHKQIPVAGGMAGGSADAAGALLGVAQLWQTGLSSADITLLAAELGSDVPFSLHGGTAVGTGRGDRLLPINSTARFHWVIALSGGSLSTPAVYRRFDDLRDAGELPRRRSHRHVLDAIHSGDPAELATVLRNDLQPAALSLEPDLHDTLTAGADAGALAGLVSGSGPTCVFLCADEPHAAEVASRLLRSGTCRDVRVAHGPVPGATVLTPTVLTPDVLSPEEVPPTTVLQADSTPRPVRKVVP